jgi:dipeptidyl aminopeptidase/acylaminoacyl peptidase
LPAVILVAEADAADRDGMIAGIPTLGQIAGALADAGFLVVRYDKRGAGQSGGRPESATLNDYAEDVRAVFRWLRERPDVDRNRIAVVGHGEGAWVALLAASRERAIAAVGSIAAPSSTGQELVLEQQRYALEQAKTPEAERAERIALQQKINAAVISGRNWEGIPADVRQQADTPWFQSFLAYDPARVLENVRQPLLLLHGDLDRQVPVAHVERLVELARRRSRAVEVVTVRGVNHLLVPAATGHVSEYPSLRDRSVSQDVMSAVSAWLTTTFMAVNQ